MSLPRGVKGLIKAIMASKSGLVGLIMLMIVVGVSVFALLYVPFNVVKEWNNPTFWQDNPRVAAPEWSSFFANQKLPRNIHLLPGDFTKYEYFVPLSGLKYVTLESHINFDFSDFPSELFVKIYADFQEYRPLAIVKLIRPDDTEVLLFRNILSQQTNNLYISTDLDIKENVANFLTSLGINSTQTIYPEISLFAIENEYMANPNKASLLNGLYQLKIEIIASNEEDTANAEFIVHGKIYGFAGTDIKRRDLFIGLVWGAPVALAFGLSAAVVVSFVQSIFGATSAWYGGIIDEVVQRFTEAYMILPFLPFLIMISIIYKVNLVILILVIVGLSLLGGVTKTSRSMTFQIMSEEYIEAAISYGASKSRILFRYIMPRLLPYILANIVLSVPFFVFLEAALSVLGLGDPMVPTWGKMISEAYSGGAALHGYWWWILLPAFLVMITASSFALIGYALDKVVNPRLREL